MLETVAAFLNTETGGTLLIGIDDDASVLGIEYDYNPKFDPRKNRDVYENNLISAILGGLGQDCGTCLRVRFAKVSGNPAEKAMEKDICYLTVSPASRPVYLRDGQDEFFYIRAGNSNRKLSVSEAMQYIKTRW